jgi:hypothetical protein
MNCATGNGKIKSPATENLMIAAGDWARRMAWTPALSPC